MLVSASGCRSVLHPLSFRHRAHLEQRGDKWFLLRIPDRNLPPGFGAVEEGVGLSGAGSCDGRGTGTPRIPAGIQVPFALTFRSRDGKARTKVRRWGDALLSSQCWMWRNQSYLGPLSVKVDIQQGWSGMLPRGQAGMVLGPVPDGQVRCNHPILRYRKSLGKWM